MLPSRLRSTIRGTMLPSRILTDNFEYKYLALLAMVPNCPLTVKGANLYPRVHSNPIGNRPLSGDLVV